MAYNVEQALKDGVPEEEIAKYLSKTRNYRLDDAVKAGVPYREIIDHLAPQKRFAPKPAPQGISPEPVIEKPPISPVQERPPMAIAPPGMINPNLMIPEEKIRTKPSPTPAEIVPEKHSQPGVDLSGFPKEELIPSHEPGKQTPSVLAAEPSKEEVPAPIPNEQVDRNNWPLRQDGTPKGNGWLGVLPMKNGQVASEATIGVSFDGKETLIPSLVPTLSPGEINYILNQEKLSPEMWKSPVGQSIVGKAVEHAKKRIAEGKSPFIGEGEQPIPSDAERAEMVSLAEQAKANAPRIGMPTLKPELRALEPVMQALGISKEGISPIESAKASNLIALSKATGGKISPSQIEPVYEEVMKQIGFNQYPTPMELYPKLGIAAGVLLSGGGSLALGAIKTGLGIVGFLGTKEAESLATQVLAGEKPKLLQGREVKEFLGPLKEPYATGAEVGELFLPTAVAGKAAWSVRNWFRKQPSVKQAEILKILDDKMKSGQTAADIAKEWKDPNVIEAQWKDVKGQPSKGIKGGEPPVAPSAGPPGLAFSPEPIGSTIPTPGTPAVRPTTEIRGKSQLVLPPGQGLRPIEPQPKASAETPEPIGTTMPAGVSPIVPQSQPIATPAPTASIPPVMGMGQLALPEKRLPTFEEAIAENDVRTGKVREIAEKLAQSQGATSIPGTPPELTAQPITEIPPVLGKALISPPPEPQVAPEEAEPLKRGFPYEEWSKDPALVEDAGAAATKAGVKLEDLEYMGVQSFKPASTDAYHLWNVMNPESQLYKSTVAGPMFQQEPAMPLPGEEISKEVMPVSEKEGKKPTFRTGEEAQKAIDDKLDELETKGMSLDEASNTSEVKKLYEIRDQIDRKDLTEWRDTILKDIGLPLEEAEGALERLGMGESVYLTAKDLREWGRDTLSNLANLYNHFAGGKVDQTVAAFRWGGTADKPVLQGSLIGGREFGWDEEALKKTEKVVNAIAKSQSLPSIDLSRISGGISGRPIRKVLSKIEEGAKKEKGAIGFQGVQVPATQAIPLDIPEGWTTAVQPTWRRTPGWQAEVDWKDKRIVFETEADSKNVDIVNHEIGHIQLEDKLGDVQKLSDSPLLQTYAKIRKEPKDTHINFIREHLAMDYGQYLTDPEKVTPELKALFEEHFPKEGIGAIPPTAQHLELLPEEYPNIEAVAVEQDGKIYKDHTHVNIVLENNLDPEKATPGFLTKQGEFVEQYPKAKKPLDPLKIRNLSLEDAAKRVNKAAKEKAQPELDELVKDIVDQYEASYSGHAKSVGSLIEKTKRKSDQNYTLYDPKDHARGTITISSVDDVGDLIRDLMAKGFIVETTIDEPLNVFGYRGINATIKLPSGLNGEIQVHTPESAKVKAKTDAIYRRWRTLNSKNLSALSPEDYEQYLGDLGKSGKLWKDYWDTIPLETRSSISSGLKGLESVAIPSVIPLAEAQAEPSSTVGPPSSRGLSQSIRPSASLESIEAPPKKIVAKGKEKVKAEIGDWSKGESRPFAFDPNSTENEGRFRLLPTESIKKESYFRRKSSTPGVSYIMGKDKDSGKEVTQAIRFDKSVMPEEKAWEWWKENRGRFQFYAKKPKSELVRSSVQEGETQALKWDDLSGEAQKNIPKELTGLRTESYFGTQIIKGELPTDYNPNKLITHAFDAKTGKELSEWELSKIRTKVEDEQRYEAQKNEIAAPPDVEGKKIEPTTERKVETPKEQKKYLIDSIDEAIKYASKEYVQPVTIQIPDGGIKPIMEKTPHVIIEVPGDGTFRVINSKQALEGFKKAVENRFPGTVDKPRSQKISKPTEKPTGRRISPKDEAGYEYISEYRPRRVVDADYSVEKTAMVGEGWFTNGQYAIKGEPPSTFGKKVEKKPLTKEKIRQVTPSLKGMSKATHVAEFHVMNSSINEGIAISDKGVAYFSPTLMDVIRKYYPDATLYIRDETSPMAFAKDKEVVGILMPMRGDPTGGLVEKYFEDQKINTPWEKEALKEETKTEVSVPTEPTVLPPETKARISGTKPAGAVEEIVPRARATELVGREGIQKQEGEKIGGTRPEVATKLKASAESLTKQIQEKRNPAVAQQNVTPRRANQTASAYEEADRLENLQNKLNALADAHEGGTVPESLRGITTRPQVENILRHSKYPRAYLHRAWIQDILNATKGKPGTAQDREILSRVMGREENGGSLHGEKEITAADSLIKIAEKAGEKSPWVKESIAEQKRMLAAGIDTEEKFAQAKTDLNELGKKPIDRSKEQKIRTAEQNLLGRKIPGYFPTPKATAERLVEEADIQPGMSVLEPSAGKGNIADVIRENAPDADLKTIEWQGELADILRLKGHEVIGSDFLEHQGKYDRIVMNPPFEKLQDIDHTLHAYQHLNPGGRLVSIMSESPFFRSDKKAVEFREWLESVGGTSEKLPEKSFNQKSERATGVTSRIVIIDKPSEARAKVGSSLYAAIPLALPFLMNNGEDKRKGVKDQGREYPQPSYLPPGMGR